MGNPNTIRTSASAAGSTGPIDHDVGLANITNYREAIDRVSQTSLREMIGSSMLSALLSERNVADELLRGEIGRKTADWGISDISKHPELLLARNSFNWATWQLSYFAARRPDTMCKDSSPMARHPMMAFTKW